MSSGENEMGDDAPNAESQDRPPRRSQNPHRVYDETDSTWPMVVVQWRDAHGGGDASWVLTEDYEPDMVYPITTGWVWPNCKPGYLTLVGTVMNHADDPEIVSDINHIPWENIVAVYSLSIHMPVNWNQEL